MLKCNNGGVPLFLFVYIILIPGIWSSGWLPLALDCGNLDAMFFLTVLHNESLSLVSN